MAAPHRGVSPSTSPRLPSPPPFPEVQITPNSPKPGLPSGNTAPDLKDASKPDDGAGRRIRPGTKAADMASGPPLVPLVELDSPFQLQEHLKALYYHHTKSDDTNTTMPITHETALILATPPDNVDRSLWLYELCRFLVQKVNSLIVAFFAESPPCSAQTCPEMRASEWQYLCAVHDPPKSCCAIDYCCHTLDWAANVLTSQKHFPSRLTLGSEAAGGSQQSVRQLTNIFRRVYRIFAHAWFQHRQVFWQVEGHEGLYILFKTVCDVFSLIPEENYTISPEAEGIAAAAEISREDQGAMAVLRSQTQDETKASEADATTTISTGATTRRHKNTPSTGSAVTTIAEGDEDEHQPHSDSDSDNCDEIAEAEASLPPPALSSDLLKDMPESENQAGTEKPEELPSQPALEQKMEELIMEEPSVSEGKLHPPEAVSETESAPEESVVEDGKLDS
ncbi:hypothetical protein MMC12_002417 [Toensbergia leucococca]|nr:hypothetical protein [Toensbergia leucococca]